MEEAMLVDVPRELFDMRHRFIRLAGEPPVHYVDEGQGPTLLLLHGNPGWSFQYRNVIHALRAQYRCVALDYPGFGLSASPLPAMVHAARAQRRGRAFRRRAGVARPNARCARLGWSDRPRPRGATP